MKLLCAYAAAGLIALLVATVNEWDVIGPRSRFVRGAMEAIDPQQKAWHYRLRRDVLAPVVIGLLIVVTWPIILVMKLRE